jgi:hypothetical protein
VAEYKALRKEIFYRLKFSEGELTQDLNVRMVRMDEIIDVDLERLRTEAIDVLGADVIEIDNKLSKLAQMERQATRPGVTDLGMPHRGGLK